MKKISLIAVAVLFALNVLGQAPDWAWAKNAGFSGAGKTCTDIDGNVYVSGGYSDSVTFGTSTLYHVGGACYIVKYTSTGNVVWAKSVSGMASLTIAPDTFGNVFVAGSSYVPVTFNTLTVQCGGWGGFLGGYVVKLDNNGNSLWGNEIYGDDHIDIGHIATDLSGNIYITGAYYCSYLHLNNLVLTNTNAATQDAFIAKYNAVGNVVWAKSSDDTNTDKIYDIIINQTGEIYITGTFSGWDITIDTVYLYNLGTPTFPFGHQCGFIFKLDLNGNAIWGKAFGQNGTYSGNPMGVSIASDITGNICIAGEFLCDTILFNNHFLVNTQIGQKQIFLAKYDSNGNCVSVNSYGGVNADAPNCMAINSSGELFLTGYFTSPSITFDTVFLNNITGSDGFLVKFNSSGSALWATSTLAYSIATNQEDAYFAGSFSDSLLTLGNITLTNLGGNNMFVAKLLGNHMVWPGDTDNSHLVDNTDLLPIGLYYGQSGTPRDSVSNLWQADSCISWGILQTNNGFDLKHVDCNGDGTIDNNDTLAINLNFNLSHAIIGPPENEQRLTAPDIYFVTSNSAYNPGDMVDVEVWAGSSTMPVDDLYGIAFDVNYTTSLVQPGTENLIYPNSWLGSPGTDAIKIGKVDALATTAYGAITRTDHTNASGFGKIADFRFLAKTSITSSSVLHLTISNYMAVDSAGVPIFFNSLPDSITINPITTNINQTSCNSFTINSQTYTTSGVYSQHLVSYLGYDSILVINLIINNADISVNQNGVILTSNAIGATYQWLDCINGNAIIIGEANQTYTVTANGDYAVLVTQNGCVDTSSCFSFANIGIDVYNTDDGISISPNPFTNEFRIECAKHKVESIKIFNVMGECVKHTSAGSLTVSGSPLTIDMSGYAKGVYFVEVAADSRIVRKKIIKD